MVAIGFLGCVCVIAKARETDGKLAAGALSLVLFQGLLGGLTVLYRLPTLVLVMHLGTSMLFLSLMIVIALRAGPRTQTSGLRRDGLLWTTTVAVYLQILLGATVRHTGAGLVCTDLPSGLGAPRPARVHPMLDPPMARRALAPA